MEDAIRGRLVRQIPVRLIDFSLAGCRVGAHEQLPSGGIVELRIRKHGKEYRDVVHLVRSTKQFGRSDTFAVAGQFQWGNQPGSASLRGEVPTADAPESSLERDERPITG